MCANILWLSDSPLTTTGFSTISWNICNKLVEAGHKVFYIGHNYIGQPIPPGLSLQDGTKFNFTLLGGSPKPYAQDLIMPYIKKFNIDIFGVLLDTFMLYPWFLGLDFAPAKSIFYYPSDGGGGLPLGCENILKKVNCPVAMSRFADKQVESLYNIKSKYIPHAIDIKNYYPLSCEEKEKLKSNWGIQDKFVVGVVARNQGRKMLDRTIKSFAEFAKTHQDAVLFMHTDPYDMAAPFDIIQLINRYKINNRVIFSGMKFFDAFDYKKMNEVYNLFDVFLLTTSGEGFGVPMIEAQACGIPAIATNYTTTYELLIEPKTGLGINLVGDTEEENPQIHKNEILDGTLSGSWNVERGMCSIKDCVKKLDYLYDNTKIREELGNNGIKNVRENYSWDVIGQKWNELIKELCE